MSRYLLLLLIVPVMFSCDIINPEEQIPTYVKIDGIRVVDKDGNEITSKVTSASISYGNSSLISLVGVFRLPMITPVLANEKGDLYILPGVDNDGRIGQSYKYPFYRQAVDTLDFLPGDTVDYGIVTCKMLDTFRADLNDDFENGSSFVIEGPDSAAETQIQNTIVASGSQALELSLMEPQEYAYYVSSRPLELKYNKATYLEFDYYSDKDFGVVVFYFDKASQSYKEFNLLGVRGKSEWNKMYVNLIDEISIFGATKLRVGFKLLRKEPGEMKVYLDNVKFMQEI